MGFNSGFKGLMEPEVQKWSHKR